MDFDLPGRIKNTKLPFSGALLPVFEAVVNSIHAVDEAPHPENGLIRVHLERDLTQQSFPSEVVGVVLGPVRSVTIRDNGIGFTDVHYKSFSTADTRQKANIGGKGIGRFLWLKAFDRAEIESTFQATDGKRYLRKFSLLLTTAGVEHHSLVEVDKAAPLSTSVRLCDYRPEFQTEVPHSAETIGRKIVEHCLEHFVLGLAPAIYLHDSGSEEVHDLNEMFEAEVKVTTTVGKFKAGGRDFQVHNLRVSPGYQGTHRLHLCANNRAVVSESLAGKIPNLVGSLRGADNRPFMYAGHVSGAYLDECVNSERTDFVMPDDDSAVHGPGWSTLLKRSIEEAASFVSPFTTSVKNAK